MSKCCLSLLMLIIPLMILGSTGLHVTLSPSLSLDNIPSVASNYVPDLEDLDRYMRIPAIFSGGMEIAIGNSQLYVNMDLRQEFSDYLMGDWLSNLPLSTTSFLPAIDVNFPRLGYFERRDSNSFISLGRRKLGLGVSTYSFVISNFLPYFDHLWIELNGQAKSGEYLYDFFAVSADRTISGGPKTLLGHRFGYMNENLKVTFGEENLVYGVYPDLQDLGPFLIYHHTYQSNSNVTATLAAEVKLSDVMAYGEFTLDDFRLTSESSNSNPTAFGWVAGFLWRISDGRPYTGPKLDESEHEIRDKTLLQDGGLRVRMEHYHSTTYLYNRGTNIGKFTYPYRFNVLHLDSWPVITGFYGFPYGPDSTLTLIGIEYESQNVSLKIAAELLRAGSVTIDSPYSPPFDPEWYGPKKPITTSFILTGEGFYAANQNTTLFVAGKLTFSRKVDFGINVGFIRMFSLL
ncbi:hypothetical protein Y696_12765 [Mesotoga sp. H07pep.5.4]|nr:hypothetical protein Y696_12765 [Mesotoga sp. H07pep.5.4]